MRHFHSRLIGVGWHLASLLFTFLLIIACCLAVFVFFLTDVPCELMKDGFNDTQTSQTTFF